jgi:hypothetical protein
VDGVSIYNSDGEFGLPEVMWRSVLVLARHYGWTSEGTHPPDTEELEIAELSPEISAHWDGRYFPGFGQHITTVDALA